MSIIREWAYNARIVKQQKSVRLFQSDFLESLTHVHPIVPALIWLPVVGYFFFGAMQSSLSVSAVAAWAFFGLLFWTLTEYTLHKYLFHFPAKSTFGKRIIYLFHGIHHDSPNDATRLVMPPVVATVLASIFLGLFWLALGPVLVLPFFAGFMSGYLIYDYIHYSTHHFRPRTVIGRYIKQNHMAHHFAEHHAKWGVSSPLWDFVFGTYHDKKRN